MCSAHGMVRKSPLYTNINRQNGRALISVPSFVYKSKIVGYSRRALSSIARNKYFSTGLERREFLLENTHTRGVWHLRSSVVTIPFSERLQISTDLRNRRLNWIAKNPSSSWQPFCHVSVTARVFTRNAHTHAYIAIAIAIDELLVTDPLRIRQQTRFPKSLRFLARAFLHPIAVLHYRTNAIWNSISLYVFPMNNIGSVSKSCRWHDRDSNNRTRTLRYRKLLILMLDRRYEIDL